MIYSAEWTYFHFVLERIHNSPYLLTYLLTYMAWLYNIFNPRWHSSDIS